MSKKKPRSLFASARSLYEKRAFRYLAVGGSVYLLELAVIIVAQRWGATPTEAVAVSFLVGLLVSFFLQKLFAFRDRRMHHRIVLTQAVAVGLLVLFNLGFTIIVTRLLQPWLPPTVTRTIALLITTIWNFYLYKTHIFNPQPKGKVPTEHPSILLRFDKRTIQTPALQPITLETPGQDDRRHSWHVVILCLLILLVLVTGGWVVATLQHSIAHGTSKRDAPLIDTPRPAPLQVSGLSTPVCQGRTVLQVVAHADDDLAFINPDTKASFTAGKCIRTVYLTAADHGWGLEYAKEREAGIQAAYDVMLSSSGAWKSHVVKLPVGQSVQVYDSPGDTHAAAVIFMRLPDGNLDGNGFPSTGDVSLRKLLDDSTLKLISIDGKASYTKRTLLKAIMQLIAVYQPIQIRTLGDTSADVLGDHSDHIATGELVTIALKQYRHTYHDSSSIPLVKYSGYPIAARRPNLSDTEEAEKSAAFFAYARHDYSVCQTMEICESGDSSYAKYLSRRYTVPSK